jgi:hypothetical protein
MRRPCTRAARTCLGLHSWHALLADSRQANIIHMPSRICRACLFTRAGCTGGAVTAGWLLRCRLLVGSGTTAGGRGCI